ncbi:hypothetical protein ABXN37_27855 [Piscinibacter sakaiensis]|uniref:hypothetical protein n=1 Tax=Piscinibacter sakaiensis TaxID=1547922 RepID=UPI00372C18BF
MSPAGHPPRTYERDRDRAPASPRPRWRLARLPGALLSLGVLSQLGGCYYMAQETTSRDADWSGRTATAASRARAQAVSAELRRRLAALDPATARIDALTPDAPFAGNQTVLVGGAFGSPSSPASALLLRDARCELHAIGLPVSTSGRMIAALPAADSALRAMAGGRGRGRRRWPTWGAAAAVTGCGRWPARGCRCGSCG